MANLNINMYSFKIFQVIGLLSRIFEEMAADGKITRKELAEKSLEFGLEVCNIFGVDVEKDVIQ